MSWLDLRDSLLLPTCRVLRVVSMLGGGGKAHRWYLKEWLTLALQQQDKLPWASLWCAVYWLELYTATSGPSVESAVLKLWQLLWEGLESTLCSTWVWVKCRSFGQRLQQVHGIAGVMCYFSSGLGRVVSGEKYDFQFGWSGSLFP